MIDPKTIVDVSTLAELFDLTAVRVQQLAADGVIVKATRGRYELLPSIRGYIGYLQQRRSNQWDAPDLTAKRARLLDAQAEEAEMNNAVRRGTLIDAKEVEAAWGGILHNCRAKLLSLPSRVAVRTTHPQPRKLAAEIDIEVRAILTELAGQDEKTDPGPLCDSCRNNPATKRNHECTDHHP